MSNIQPNIGIVIPCHNHIQYIDNAIHSVLQQDYTNKTMCVVDDGSTDGVYEYLRNKLKNPVSIQSGLSGQISDINTILVRNEIPGGPSIARNTALKYLLGFCNAVCMLDADDAYLPGKITKCVDKWSESPEIIGIVYHDIIINNIINNTFIYEYREPYNRQRLEQEDIICNCPLVSTKALQVCGGYDPEMRTCEDWDLWLRITTRFAAVHIPQALAIYSVTGKNSSDTVDKSVWQQNWNIIRQRLQRQHGQS